MGVCAPSPSPTEFADDVDKYASRVIQLRGKKINTAEVADDDFEGYRYRFWQRLSESEVRNECCVPLFSWPFFGASLVVPIAFELHCSSTLITTSCLTFRRLIDMSKKFCKNLQPVGSSHSLID